MRVLHVVFLLGLCASFTGCDAISALTTEEPKEPGDFPRPNILLLTVDTLRADHTQLNGYERKTTPEIAAFFKDDTVYEHAYSAASKTAESCFSFLSGLYPQNHGVRLHRQKLHDGLMTVPKVLGLAGYQTAAVVSNSVLGREASGLDTHFHHFDDYVFQKEAHRTFYERTAQPTTDAALKWLTTKRSGDKPVFLWVHYMDPHGP
jgi:arylsulfatase A-like enzyme